MPAKDLIIERRANKDFKKLPLQIHKKLNKAFDELKQNPIAGEKLHGDLDGYYKYRIGDYRIVYSFDPEKSLLIVFKIEHRQGVYK